MATEARPHEMVPTHYSLPEIVEMAGGQAGFRAHLDCMRRRLAELTGADAVRQLQTIEARAANFKAWFEWLRAPIDSEHSQFVAGFFRELESIILEARKRSAIRR